MSAAANSVSIKKFNSMKEDQGIPLPPPLPPKVGIVKQGIVSILGSDSTERLNKAASIRRTLSADMSSKNWLSQNGFFSPMKKIASSEELANNDHFSSSFEGEEDHHELIKRPGQDDVWRSIQNNNKNKEPITTSVDVWSSILSQKKEESPTEQLPPPYIHPLVKRSSSLTEKSLEICTESLGSETGSDQSFSSYPPSETETGDVIDEEKEDQQQQQHEEIFSQSFDEVPVVKYNNKRSSCVPKSFPPPITSLAREDKPCVHMQSHRQNGRLILEAVSVPPQNLFRAQRHDGRLLLTLITTSETEDCDQGVEFQKVFDDNIEGFEYEETPHLDYDGDDGSEEEEEEYEDDEEEEEEEKDNGTKGMQIVLEQNSRMSNGRMNVNTSTLMMKQLMGLHKKDHLTCSNNFNLIDELPQSLPPPTRISQLIQSTNIPPSATPPPPASFNAYEYFWRKNPTVAATIVNSPPTKNNYNDKNQVVQAANYSTTLNANSTTKIASYEQEDLVLMRGNNKGNINYLVPLSNGCKEARRSLLIWEPYCIATS